jgi:hypothetical protein
MSYTGTVAEIPAFSASCPDFQSAEHCNNLKFSALWELDDNTCCEKTGFVKKIEHSSDRAAPAPAVTATVIISIADAIRIVTPPR